MKNDLSVFRDPGTGVPLDATADALFSARGARYPVVNGIPRFVSLGARDITVRIGGNGVEAFCRKPR